MSSLPTPSRRRAITTIAAICCCASGRAALAAPIAVDQITDLSATAATQMFRFEPDLVQVAPGESVAILNSRADHTVHSIPQFWPEDAPKVGISNKREALVAFPVDGLYGFRCRRHGQYGMLMLVAAGAGEDPAAARERIDAMRARSREKAAFSALLDRYAILRDG